VARNLYTVVSVVDPLSIGGVSLLLTMEAMFRQQYPLRMGVVLDCGGAARGGNSGWPASGMEVCFLYAHVKAHHNSARAVGFLLEVANVLKMALEGELVSLARAEVEGIYEGYMQDLGKAGWTAADELTAAARAFRLGRSANGEGAEADADADTGADGVAFVAATDSYLEARGLPTNSFSLNGQVVTSPDLGEELMPLLGREQHMVRSAMPPSAHGCTTMLRLAFAVHGPNYAAVDTLLLTPLIPLNCSSQLSALVRSGKLSDETKSVFSAMMAIGRRESESRADGADEEEAEDPMAAMMGGGAHARVGRVYNRFHPLLGSGEPVATVPLTSAAAARALLLLEPSFISVPRGGARASDVDEDDVSCPRTSIVLRAPASLVGFRSAAQALLWLRASDGDVGRLFYRLAVTFTHPTPPKGAGPADGTAAADAHVPSVDTQRALALLHVVRTDVCADVDAEACAEVLYNVLSELSTGSGADAASAHLGVHKAAWLRHSGARSEGLTESASLAELALGRYAHPNSFILYFILIIFSRTRAYAHPFTAFLCEEWSSGSVDAKCCRSIGKMPTLCGRYDVQTVLSWS